jgi:mono/diheme cytochrome c family protein
MKILRHFGFLLFLLAMIQFGCQTEARHIAKSDLEKGEELYISYCKICHGDQGDGPMAKLLNVPAPDLTLIEVRWDGEFPEQYVHDYIEGSEKETEGHYAGDMPIWRDAIMKAQDTDEEGLEIRLNQLVTYIKSIQREYY